MDRYPTLTLKPQAARRPRGSHPWIFSNELLRSSMKLEPGALVDVRDRGGNFVGRGYYNPGTLIAVRLLAREPVEIHEGFFEGKLIRALAHRERWLPNEEACRLVFGEADGLPGLVVDRYGTVLVTQFLTAGMDRFTETILAVLLKRLKPTTVLARNDAHSRLLEGLKEEKKLLHGPRPGSVVVKKNGLSFEVDVWDGQKTGFFLDQAENYLLLKEPARGTRVLDAFCYTGAWGIHAARYGAREVIGMDSSEKALALARSNADRNAVGTVCQFLKEDVFDGLRRLDSARERFDMVILDPPAFAKSRTKVKEALRGYKEINRLAMRLLSPGGILVSCSCSHLVDAESFRDRLASAAADAGRTFTVAEWRSQGRDHPILLAVPETRYLKCVVLEAR